jgi:hypothetical protein
MHKSINKNMKLYNRQKDCQICQIFIYCHGILILLMNIEYEKNQEIVNSKI